MTLDQVGEETAKLPEDRVPEGQDWAKLSASWGERIDEHIAELQRLRTGLTGCIGCGCLSLGRCELANPGGRAGRSGPLPRDCLFGTAPPREPRSIHRYPPSVARDTRSRRRVG